MKNGYIPGTVEATYFLQALQFKKVLSIREQLTDLQKRQNALEVRGVVANIDENEENEFSTCIIDVGREALVEGKLKDRQYKKKVVKVLAMQGGDDVKEAVKRVMGKLFTEAAMCGYSRVGGENKRKLIGKIFRQ